MRRALRLRKAPSPPLQPDESATSFQPLQSIDNYSCYYDQRTIDNDWHVAKPLGADVKRKSKTPNEIFGRAVTELRMTKNLSQASLADFLDYSTYYFGKIERGKANVSCDVMAAVSAYFNMSIGQLWLYAEKLSKTQGNKK